MSSSVITPLSGKNVRGRFFVLVADVFDQLGIEHDVQVALGVPGTRIDFRIVDGQLDFEAAVVGAANSLDGAAGGGKRVALQIEPLIVFVPDRFHYQRLAVPMSH